MKVIVAGAGEVGFNIAEKLSREKYDVVLIDLNEERLAQVMDVLDVQTICGSVSRPDILLKAGLKQAELLIAVTSSDESNILASRLAQLMAPEVRRVSRVRDSSWFEGLDEKEIEDGLGLNFIIDPSTLIVETILDFMEIPGAVDVIDVSSGRLKLIGVRLSRHHPARGLKLSEILPRDQGHELLIVAIYRNHELLIPKGDTILKVNDLVYVAATPEHLPLLARFFNLELKPADNVFILGGGDVGLALARRLEEKGVSVKLVEQNQDRCEFLSQELKKTIVLKGDATDQNLMEDEGVADCDVFIAVGTDDEKNMIACLVARRLGAASTITRVNRYSYVPLVSAIGLESLVSPRVAAVSAILKSIRKGLVVSVATLQNEDAEILEIAVPEGSHLVGRTLAQARLPAEIIIAALFRDEETLIPRGSTLIMAGDILAVVVRTEAVHQLEKVMAS